jgi:hypothetical protein
LVLESFLLHAESIKSVTSARIVFFICRYYLFFKGICNCFACSLPFEWLIFIGVYWSQIEFKLCTFSASRLSF